MANFPFPFTRGRSAMPPAWPEERGALFTSRGVGGGPVYSTDHTDYRDTPSPNPSRRREGNK
jgi:hypothetical protein